MAILFTSAFSCPPFLLCSTQRPMAKSRSYRFFTWMSQIAHQNHFICFTSTFDHWLSVCRNILNILTVPVGAEDLVIVSSWMRFRGSSSSFSSYLRSRQRDAVSLLPIKLIPPIAGGATISVTDSPKLPIHDSPLEADMDKDKKYTIWIPKLRNTRVKIQIENSYSLSGYGYVNLKLSANYPVHPRAPTKSSAHAYTQNCARIRAQQRTTTF